MKRIILGSRKNIRGLVLVFCLCLPGLCLAYTPVQDFSQSAEENYFMGQLSFYTYDEKAAGNSNFLEVALGQAAFTCPVYNPAGAPVATATIAVTGIKDSRPYIRRESARLIDKFGFNTIQVQALKEAAALEKDPITKEVLSVAATSLAFRLSPNKEQFISNFLTQECVSAQAVQEKIGSLICLIEEARYHGFTGLKDPLGQLITNFFQTDDVMKKRIQEISATLDIFQANGITSLDRILQERQRDPGIVDTLKAVYLAAMKNSSYPLMGNWAVDALTREENAIFQAVASKLFLELFAQKDGRCFMLEYIMEREGINWRENQNSNFAFGTTIPPADWSISGQNATPISYVDDTQLTYARCLQILNELGNTLSLTNSPVSFSGNLPSLEFGLSYSMVNTASSPCLATSGNEASVYFPETGSEQIIAQDSQVKVRLHITLQDGTSSVAYDKAVERLDNFGYFETFRDRFTTVGLSSGIASAWLEIVISGKTPIRITDVFLRRSEQAFRRSLPEIKSLTVPAAALVGEYIRLQAQAVVADGSRVSGQWSSNLEGNLGSEGMDITVRLTQPGSHNLTFTARNEFGDTDSLIATINVVKPIISLSARRAATAPEIPLYNTTNAHYLLRSGSLPFVVSVQGLGQLASSFRVTEYGLYLNDALLMTSSIGANFSPVFWLDTCRLPNGINWIKAGVKLQRTGTTAVYSFYSDLLSFYVQNDPKLSKAPKITAPKYDALVSAQVDASVSFDNPTARPQYVDYQLLDAQNKVLSSWRATTPYSLRLNLTSFQYGIYNLVAVASYSGGVTAYSDKVKITKDATPPVISNISTNYAKSFANGLEIKADISDPGSGVNYASVYYQRNYLSNGQYVWSAGTAKPMSLFASPATYKATFLSSEVSGSYAVKYYIKAWDKAGNCKVSATATLPGVGGGVDKKYRPALE